MNKYKATRRKYYLKNRKRIIERNRLYALKNREKVLIRMREYGRNQYANNPEFREKTKEKNRRNYRKYIAWYTLRNAKQIRTPEQRARLHLHYKVKIGAVIRPKKCDGCNVKCKPHGHHYKGYKDPLKVIWLCRKCHGIAHRH